MARKKITTTNFEFYGVVSEIDKEILKKIAEINSVEIAYSATDNLLDNLACDYYDAKVRLEELEEKRLDDGVVSIHPIKQFRKWVTSEVLPTIRKHGNLNHSADKTRLKIKKACQITTLNLVAV